MEAILTGEPIPAERAYALGLVSRLAEPGQAVAEARRLADQITQRPAGGLGEPRRRPGRRLRGRRDAEGDDERGDADLMGSEDLKEGSCVHREAAAGLDRSLSGSAPRDGDQPGGDPRPLVEVLGIRSPGRGVPSRSVGAGGRATSVAASSRASPYPSSWASAVTKTCSTSRSGDRARAPGTRRRAVLRRAAVGELGDEHRRVATVRAGHRSPINGCSSSHRWPPRASFRPRAPGLQHLQRTDITLAGRNPVGVDHAPALVDPPEDRAPSAAGGLDPRTASSSSALNVESRATTWLAARLWYSSIGSSSAELSERAAARERTEATAGSSGPGARRGITADRPRRRRGREQAGDAPARRAAVPRRRRRRRSSGHGRRRPGADRTRPGRQRAFDLGPDGSSEDPATAGHPKIGQ